MKILFLTKLSFIGSVESYHRTLLLFLLNIAQAVTVRRSGVAPCVREGLEARPALGHLIKHVEQIARGSGQPVEA